MVFNEKEYLKKTKKGCKISKNSSFQKECVKVSNCKLDKCKQQVIDYENALPSDEERELCNKEAKNDYAQEFECIAKIGRERNPDSHNAKLEHCVANECPNIYEFNKKVVSHMMDGNGKKKTYKQQCAQKHCKNEIDEIKQNDFIEFDNICNKKYNNIKEQSKCKKKGSKIYNKKIVSAKKCAEKHCTETKTNNTKKHNTKKHNTKITKTSI